MDASEIVAKAEALKRTVENVETEVERLTKEKVEQEERLAITRNAIAAVKLAGTQARTELATIRKALRG